jgi:Holliday junction resolvasome, helicase subunit
MNSELETRILSPAETFDDSETENPLRPQTLDEYIGQEKVKENLSVFIEPLLSKLVIDTNTQCREEPALLSRPTTKPEVPTYSEIMRTNSGARNFYESIPIMPVQHEYERDGIGPVYSEFGKLWQEHPKAMTIGTLATGGLIGSQLLRSDMAPWYGFSAGLLIATKGIYSAFFGEDLSPRRRFDHALNATCALGMSTAALAYSGTRSPKMFALYSLATAATAVTYVNDNFYTDR